MCKIEEYGYNKFNEIRYCTDCVIMQSINSCKYLSYAKVAEVFG